MSPRRDVGELGPDDSVLVADGGFASHWAGLLYDTSGVTDTAGTLAGKLGFRDPSETFKIAFQRENATDMERRVSENYAQVDSITRSGAEKSLYTVTVSIYPTADSEIYDYYLGPKA